VNILNIQCFNGRNIYSHKPVIKSVINLGEWYDTPTRDITNFNINLVKILPGLSKHYCSCGYEGGFVERLQEGTYLAHVTEHVALELQHVVGYDVYYGKSRLHKSPAIYNVIIEFVNEKLALECLIAAVGISNSLISGNLPNISEIIQHLKKVDSESSLGPSTRAIYDEAKRRGIPVEKLGNESILRLGYGKNSRYVEASLTDKPNCISIDIAGNKHLTNYLLSSNGIPVPFGDIAYTMEFAEVTASLIGYPVVIKPFDANQGKGVILNIMNRDELQHAFKEAIKFSRAVLVEKYISGKDFRVLVIGGKVSAVSERNPPFVIGDGVHTVRELVAIENENPLRGFGHEKPLTKLSLDDTACRVLNKFGYNTGSTPPKGWKVLLRENGNLSTGGTARDCTDEIHPSNAAIAIKAAEILGLDIAGVDITASDIAVPIKNGEGAVIEVNAAPGLRMHLYPTSGNARNVAGDIIDMLYPEDVSYNIPVVSVTGTNGKTTVTRLISHVLSLSGITVGMTTTSGIYIDNKCVAKGDNTGPISAGIVLSDKRVEAAVLETARGGLVRKGLGYDMADVGVIVNVSEDHLGLDGIETLEDLAFTKSLVVEAVKEDGYAVLNGDDEMTPYILQRLQSKIVLFSRNVSTELVSRHVENGGKAVFARNGSIYINDGNNEYFLMKVDEIPITFNEKAECNVENSLAAISTLYALNMPLNIIRTGMKTFKPDIDNNPGRFNIIEFDNFKVMLDYGHNPAGYNAVIQLMNEMNATRYVGVIGMPGDRNDTSISKVGKLCGKAFSQIYIKEDKDLRGRKQGETAEMLYNAVIEGGLGKNCVDIIYSELEALEAAISKAQYGDLIVLFYENFEEALGLINRLKNEEKAGKSYEVEEAG
jgi:cyanophycin synthetase